MHACLDAQESESGYSDSSGDSMLHQQHDTATNSSTDGHKTFNQHGSQLNTEALSHERAAHISSDDVMLDRSYADDSVQRQQKQEQRLDYHVPAPAAVTLRTALQVGGHI